MAESMERPQEETGALSSSHVDAVGFFSELIGYARDSVVVGSFAWLASAAQDDTGIVTSLVSRTVLDGLGNTVLYGTGCDSAGLTALLARNYGVDPEDPEVLRHLKRITSLRKFGKITRARLRQVAPSIKTEALAEISGIFGPGSIPEWLIPVAALAAQEAQSDKGRVSAARFRTVLANTLLWANWPAERVTPLVALLSPARADFFKVTETGSWGVIL